MAPDRPRDTHADAESSFELLNRGHRADVFRAALRELGNVHDAEDVTQAAFVDAYRAVLRGTRPESPRARLLAIAENVRRRRFRASLRGPREEPLDESVAPAAEEPHERAAALLDALDALAGLRNTLRLPAAISVGILEVRFANPFLAGRRPRDAPLPDERPCRA